MVVFYVLPNQLFDASVSKVWKGSYERVVIWEHPDFFKKYKFNKKKLILHRASMRSYTDRLRKAQTCRVQYVEFHEQHTPPKSVEMYDPINELREFDSNMYLESPNFLMSREDMHALWEGKTSKDSMRFTTYFYPRVKKLTSVLTEVDSKDKENRGRYDGSVPVPKLPSTSESKYVKEAVRYVEKHFARNPGTSTDFRYPVDTKEARIWLRDFVKRRLKYFGTFQDAVVQGEPWMFHSVLSSSINVGLLNPSEILKLVMSSSDEIPMNSLEGYVRQLIWREYQRYCYVYLRETLVSRNRFETKNRLGEEWYDGSTGVLPVDVSVQKAFETGYLHHIERLMVIGNFMLLSEIKREDGFRWFMEFAIDSYEWVMYQNVYDMVFFSTGGKTTHKAYISGSPYIRRMTNYSNGEWTKRWDDLYNQFRGKHFNKKV